MPDVHATFEHDGRSYSVSATVDEKRIEQLRCAHAAVSRFTIRELRITTASGFACTPERSGGLYAAALRAVQRACEPPRS